MKQYCATYPTGNGSTAKWRVVTLQASQMPFLCLKNNFIVYDQLTDPKSTTDVRGYSVKLGRVQGHVVGGG